MTDPTIDPAYLQYQYGDAEKLRIRQESHERYGEHPQSFLEWMLPHIAPQPGLLLLDVGCGPGTYHVSHRRGRAALLRKCDGRCHRGETE